VAALPRHTPYVPMCTGAGLDGQDAAGIFQKHRPVGNADHGNALRTSDFQNSKMVGGICIYKFSVTYTIILVKKYHGYNKSKRDHMLGKFGFLLAIGGGTWYTETNKKQRSGQT